MKLRFFAKSLILLVLFNGFVFADNVEKTTNIDIHLVGNAHIDLAYRWRWDETVDRIAQDTFEGVLKMMKKEPGLTFAQSQMALYEEMQKNNPDLFRQIKERINQGRWSVVGGQWAEADAILPGGESMIRQFLIGKEYAQKNLGVKNIIIGWTPDAFSGQALTIPKIFSGCGIKYYVFGRGAPEGKRIFWWQSSDGSRVLAYKIPQHYNLRIDEKMKSILAGWSKLADYNQVMVLYGEGDHGGGPRQPDIDAIHHFQGIKDFPSLRYDTPEKYFAALEKAEKKWPVYKGEMGLGKGENEKSVSSWRGAYTSQARAKKANRDMENLLITSEKFATIGSMLQRKPLFPRVDFREAWKIVLRNQFHDILPGTAIGDVYDDAMSDYLYIKDEGERLLRFGLEVIGSRIDTRGDGIPLVVYNPHSWSRTDIVETVVRFVMEPDQFTIKDDRGQSVLYQVDRWSDDGLTAYISFLAKDIPAVGYKVFRVLEEEPQRVDTDIMFGPDFVVNKYFKIKWDNSGLTSIYDKKLHKELLSGDGNTLQLLEENKSSSWDLSLTGRVLPLKSLGKPRVIEEGPVRAVLQWQDRDESSYFSREIIVKAGIPRLQFKMTVDWHDNDKLLKVAFPTEVDSGRAFFEQPYGYLQHATDGTEWPAQNWIDLSNKKFGVALLNDGKYGFDVNQNVMRMSVVRGARDMDPRMDEGMHSFDYAIYSHKGDWREGNVTQQALELNQPLIAMQENHHIGTLPAWGRLNVFKTSLGKKLSFFSINSDHVIISAIKVQQGDWSPANIVLRIFETEGRDDDVTVNLPVNARKIIETNLVEEPIEAKSEIIKGEKKFTFRIGHNQIRTFLIRF